MSPHHARVPVPTAAPASPEPTTAPPTVAPASAMLPAPLTVGHADDPAEHRADALADVALSRLDASGEAHRHDPGCGHLRRSVSPSAGSSSGPSSGAVQIGLAGGDLDSTTSGRIEARRGSGAPLPGGVRRRMETAFGTGLGHVRVHDGPEAAALSSAMSAEAFTTGSDIFFGAGRFAPHDPAGERVLAHEIAHVVQEGPAVRRLTIFGKHVPGTKKEDPAEKAARERAKAEEKAKKQAVKQSKQTIKDEKERLAQSRETGVQGRAQLQESTYANGLDEAQGKVTDLYKRMSQAREREVEIFAELQANKLGGSDAQRAKLAFKQVWYVEFPDLTHVRPARETDAEVLVAEVRQVRGDAAASQTAEAADAALAAERMLPKAVEKLYDRMVVVRDELLEADPDASEHLVMEEAREKVLATVAAEQQGKLPPKDGPLDQAAWAAASTRGEARRRQAARDADNAQANLQLLDPTQRIGPQQQESSPIGSAASSVMEKVGKFGGYGLDAIDKVGGGIAGKVGSKKDKELRKDLPKDDDKDPTSPVPSVLDPLGVGKAYESGAKAAKMRSKGQRDVVEKDLPTSDATLAKEGIGNVVSVLKSIVDAVQSGLGMAQQIEASWTTKDPYEGLKAAKSGAGMLGSLVSAAKETANLAKTIDSGVSAGVKSVIPGLDIASAAISMVSGITDVATTGMRQRETDIAMFEARAGSAKQVDVMVYPLMKVSQVYTKQLEKNCWSLGSSILDFSLSIAQVASGGGFGIPAAIKASATVVDKLHTLAHYIADKVLGAQAKRAEKESAVMHLEGAAEDELKKHPKMAVDAIVMRAAKGDPTALAFLANYRINGKPITKDYVAQIKPQPRVGFDPNDPKGPSAATSNDALLLKIREVVLAGMDVEADPQSVFEDLKSQVDGVTGKGASVRDAWNEAGQLRDDRNTLAGKGALGKNSKNDRGLFWRLRMTIDNGKREQLKARTQVYQDVSLDPLPQGVACAVGSLELKLDASPVDMTQFLEKLDVAQIEAELSRTPRRNSPEWIAFLRDALKQKKSAPVGSGTP